MNVQPLDSTDSAVLAEFAAAHPQGRVEQSWAWGELQTRIPGRPAFRVFGLFEEGRMIGSMLVVRQMMGAGKSWLWCPGGPLLPAGAEEGKEGWALLLEACKNWARLHGDVFLRIEPRSVKGEDWPAGGSVVQERYLPGDTLVLDLTLSEAEILSQMSQNGRSNIRRAEKQGVAVREVVDPDLHRGVEAFYGLLADTAERDAFSVHRADFYRDFLETLGGKLYLAYEGEAVVAGILVVYFGDTATYYFGASSSAHRESRASYLLQWTAIREAKAAGMKVYDFLGIAPEGDAAHALAGVTHFKTRFGGKRVSYHSAQVFVFRPFWWLVYRLAKLFRR